MSGWKQTSDQKSTAGVWVIADAQGNELQSGTNGLAGLNEFLGNENAQAKVLFAAFRVHGVDQQENVTSQRPKIVRINFVGPKVPAMKKMEALQGKQNLARIWNGVAAEIDTQKPPSMNDIAVVLLRSGGAHKPTHYDFGDCQIKLGDVANKAE